MPTYEFVCDKCSKAFEMTMTIAERQKARITCPHCGDKNVKPQMTTFSAQTSRKSAA